MYHVGNRFLLELAVIAFHAKPTTRWIVISIIREARSQLLKRVSVRDARLYLIPSRWITRLVMDQFQGSEDVLVGIFLPRTSNEYRH